MRQTTMGELRLDHRKAASSGLAGEQSAGLAADRGGPIEFGLRRNHPGTDDQLQRTGNPGNVGSVLFRGRAGLLFLMRRTLRKHIRNRSQIK